MGVQNYSSSKSLNFAAASMLALFAVACTSNPTENSSPAGAAIIAASGLVENQAASESQAVGKIKITARAHACPSLPFEAAVVRVARVELKSGSGKVISFVEEHFDLNLMDLPKSLEAIMNRARLPEGKYKEIQLIMADDGTVLLSSDGKLDVTVPSGEKSGIKVMLDDSIEIKKGRVLTLGLAFDLCKSFQLIGNDKSHHHYKEYHFKPVVHAEAECYEDQNPEGDNEAPDAEHVEKHRRAQVEHEKKKHDLDNDSGEVDRDNDRDDDRDSNSHAYSCSSNPSGINLNSALGSAPPISSPNPTPSPTPNPAPSPTLTPLPQAPDLGTFPILGV